MHCRMTTVTGASDLDEGITFVREKVVPMVRNEAGYRGLAASVDRQAGTMGVITLWESAEDMAASDAAVSAARNEFAGLLGGRPTVETFEVHVNEIGDPPPAEGCKLRVVSIEVDPERIDDQVAWFRQQVVPAIRTEPGFRALRFMADRTTGRCRVASVWSDDEALRASRENFARRREAATERGVDFVAVEEREIALNVLNT